MVLVVGDADGGVIGSQSHRDSGGAAGEDVKARVAEGANEAKVSVPCVVSRVPETGTALAAVEGTSDA